MVCFMKVQPHSLPGQWAISHPVFSTSLVAAAKATPGMRWSAGDRAWVGHADAAQLCLGRLKIALDYALTGRPFDFLGPIASKGRRKYQLEAVNFLLEKGLSGAILGDAMGLGKTCSALTAARALSGRTIVVCPSYVRGVWSNEADGGQIARWWPGVKEKVFLPSGIKGPFKIPTGTKVVVIHYDILHAWAQCLIDWDARVSCFDEGHLLQNESSQRSKAARAIALSTKYRWALTGTPLTNRVRDLWNLVDVVSPGRFGNFFSFGLRYCDAHKEAVTPTKTVWKFDGKSHLDELNWRLGHFCLRRTASDVKLELPPKTRQMIWVEVPRKARLYGDASPKELRRYLNAAADAKLPDAWAIIKGHLEQGHKVVAFTYRRDVAEWLTNESRESDFATALVHGGVSHARRGKAIEEAKKAVGASLLAATIDSCSTGIDLSYADVCVFVELDWKPHALLQGEARLHRFGQANPVLIQYILARGTTDELVANAVVGKLDTFEAVVGTTGESLGGDLHGSDEDILEELYAGIAKMKV